jgi:hypothetical protein
VGFFCFFFTFFFFFFLFFLSVPILISVRLADCLSVWLFSLLVALRLWTNFARNGAF